MLTKKFTIVNKYGLHARSAARLVTLSSRYSSKINIVTNTKCVDAKSIMGVLTLAATQGTEIEVTVYGDDEVEALKALEELINDGFGEE